MLSALGAMALLPAVLAAQGPDPVLKQGLIRPAWIDVLPQQAGRIYAVGVASSGGNAAQVVKQASQNARLELATRLRASVKGETTVNSQAAIQRGTGSPATASSHQQVTQASRITTQIAELTGLGIAETWTDPDGQTVYALACLDLDAAMVSLKSRARAVRSSLGVEVATEPREAARAILRLRKGRSETLHLDDLAAPLIEAGADPGFRPQVQELLADIDRRADGLRGMLTLGVEKASSLPPELVAALRAAAQQQGFGWVDGKGLLTVRIQVGSPSKGLPWWTLSEEADFITASGALSLSLADPAGNPLGTANLDVTGVGTSTPGATQGLLKDVRRKFDTTLDRWLADFAQ